MLSANLNMSDNTRISYVDASWSPVRSCSPAGVGCLHCFSAALASRFHTGPFAGLASGGKWTGTPRFVPEQLEVPMRWKRPRVILTPTMGDLFHPAIATADIVSVFEVMSACERHTFLSLTKRPERMADVLYGAGGNWYLGGGDYLANVWLGTSVSAQADVDRAVPALLSTGIGWHYWLSVEPLLGPVDLSICWLPRLEGSRVSFVVVGGESGPSARPCRVEWIRDVVRQCREAGVACWVKQLGANAYERNPDKTPGAAGCVPVRGKSRAGSDPDEWPEDLRVQCIPKQMTPSDT